MFFKLITELLQDGYTVNFCASGHSMYPTILANETIVVEPIDPGSVRLGDIILYRTNSRLTAHRVIRIEKETNADLSEPFWSTHDRSQTFSEGESPLLPAQNSGLFDNCGTFRVKRSSPSQKVGSSTSEALYFVLRGDAGSACDELVKAGQILGKVVSIERNGCSIDPYSLTHKLSSLAFFWAIRIKRLPRLIFSTLLNFSQIS
jgi:hypothetical protein